LIRDATIALILKIIGTSLWLGYAIILARVLPQDEFGLVFYVVNFVLLVAPIAGLGFENTTLRFGAVYWQDQESGRFRTLLSQARKAALFGGGICCAGLAIAAALGLDNPLVDNASVSILSGIAVLLFTLMGVHRDALRAAKQLVAGMMGTTIIRSLIPITGSVLYTMFGTLNAFSALVLFVAGLFSSVCYELRSIAKLKLKPQSRQIRDIENHRRVATRIWLADIASVILVRADAFIVGAVLNLETAAIYIVAQRLAGLPYFLFDAIRMVIAPEISRNFDQSFDKTTYHSVVARSSAFYAIAGILGSAGMIVLGMPLLYLFGSAYADAYVLVVILVLGQLSLGFFGPSAIIMTMTNLERERSIYSGIIAILFVFSVWFGAVTFSIFGAATAVAILTWINSVGLSYLTWRKQGIWPGLFNPDARRNIVTELKTNGVHFYQRLIKVIGHK
jgi:O-antigen/teichoic acid export membrane protein